jgi:hypothetical protein
MDYKFASTDVRRESALDYAKAVKKANNLRV